MNFREAQEATRAGTIPRIEGSCKRCEGWGYTADEAPLFRDGVTLEQGRGCTRCKGDGIDPEWPGKRAR